MSIPETTKGSSSTAGFLAGSNRYADGSMVTMSGDTMGLLMNSIGVSCSVCIMRVDNLFERKNVSKALIEPPHKGSWLLKF